MGTGIRFCWRCPCPSLFFWICINWLFSVLLFWFHLNFYLWDLWNVAFETNLCIYLCYIQQDVCSRKPARQNPNTKASNHCTAEMQSYPGRFCKDRFGPDTATFLMKDSAWLAAKTSEMTPALKPGCNFDRAVCLKQPDIWINVQKDLTGFPSPEQKIIHTDEANFENVLFLGGQVTQWELIFIFLWKKITQYRYIYLLYFWNGLYESTVVICVCVFLLIRAFMRFVGRGCPYSSFIKVIRPNYVQLLPLTWCLCSVLPPFLFS